jgi:hypothetical protein
MHIIAIIVHKDLKHINRPLILLSKLVVNPVEEREPLAIIWIGVVVSIVNHDIQ